MDTQAPLTKLQAINQRIAHACLHARRPVDSVRLLAVSKTFAVEKVLELAAHGQLAFGENYVQEGVEKIALARHQTKQPLQWHFIGPLQSNKTRPVAQIFDWVHSVDRLKIAQRLSEQRASTSPPLQVCIQVNISGEASKSGCHSDQVQTLAQQIQTLPNLVLRGLMALPEAPEQGTVGSSLLNQYAQMQQHYTALQLLCGPMIDTLSMGMSADLEAAIKNGSTMVRVGSALFGSR